MVHLVDTHCHIHSADYPLSSETVITHANSAGVDNIICVGTSLEDSELAVAFVKNKSNCTATAGHHPHGADNTSAQEIKRRLGELAGSHHVVGIGECGLDYYYSHSARTQQRDIFRAHLEVATEHALPLILHIRGSKENPGDAFKDVWQVLDDFSFSRGVVHSFSAGQRELNDVLSRGLCVGLNGIVTFANPKQIDALRNTPLEKVVLETDAPFLTPAPNRGKVNEPAYLADTVRFLARLWDKTFEEVGSMTTRNAYRLFNLKRERSI